MTKQSGPIEKMIQRAKRTLKGFYLSPGYGLLSELNNYIKKSIFRICICATELRETAFSVQKINEFDGQINSVYNQLIFCQKNEINLHYHVS